MYCSRLFCLAVVLMAHSVLSETFHEVMEECNKKNGFTGDLEKLNYNDPAFPKEAKCSLACSLEKRGVLKADGSIDKEKEKEVQEEIIEDKELRMKFNKAIEECDITAKANKCETAYEFVKCLYTKAGVV